MVDFFPEENFNELEIINMESLEEGKTCRFRKVMVNSSTSILRRPALACGKLTTS